jgi:hypothetical protein
MRPEDGAVSCSDISSRYTEQERVEDDPSGTYLPDIAAALPYAEYTIRELRKKIGHNDLAPDDDRNG